jgi:hypothetical protein
VQRSSLHGSESPPLKRKSSKVPALPCNLINMSQNHALYREFFSPLEKDIPFSILGITRKENFDELKKILSALRKRDN